MSAPDTPPFVVASHPSRQGFFYRVPLAAQRCGLPGVFLTGLYYKPDRPAWRLAARLPGLADRLPARREAELDDARVVSPAGILPELLPRLTGGYRAANALHDACAATWLRRRLATHPGPVVVHGAIGAARDTFRAARRLGMTCVLEVTLPPGAQEVVAAAGAAAGLSVPAPRPQDRELEELALADVVLAQNRFSLELLRDRGVPPERLVLLPLGADLAAFRPAEGPRRPGPLRVLFVGHQSVRKGLHHLLEAWDRLAPEDAELLLAGPVTDGSGGALHRRHAGSFTDLGTVPHDRLPALYAEADLFVMPSLYEGGPLVVLEAMASGLPCLVTEAAASVVEPEESGLVVRSGDTAALAEGLRRLLEDARLRRRLGAAARTQAADFGWDRHAERLCRLYRSLGRGEPPPALTELAPLRG
jgi:glycosyltransferase involved in cell wall biosynthesis